MALLRNEPNYYAVDAVPYATSTGAATGAGYALDFNANQLHVYNDRAAVVYLGLGTSTPSSAFALRVCSTGGALVLRDVLLSRWALYCTATSTATFVRCLAVGA